MSWLRKQRRRKDAVFSYQRVSFQLSKIGAVLPFDCFDCATKWGNNLQGTCGTGTRFAHGVRGIPGPQMRGTWGIQHFNCLRNRNRYSRRDNIIRIFRIRCCHCEGVCSHRRALHIGSTAAASTSASSARLSAYKQTEKRHCEQCSPPDTAPER